MSRRLGLVAAVCAVAVVAAACTGDVSRSESAAPSTSASATSGPTLPAVTPGASPTFREAIADLCVPISAPAGTPASGQLPAELATIADEVEQVRGHGFEKPPVAEAISDAEMDRRLRESFEAYYPEDLYDRRTFAWRTIGVIPPNDADLHEAYRRFLTGNVVGFYDPQTGELVYQGSGDLGFAERLTLAHELTHALDDQVFDLKRLDEMTTSCRDEELAAALGLVEGSAQYFSAASIAENPNISLGDLLEAIAEAATSGSVPEGVPPFLYDLATWPYSGGMAFVGTLAGRGGTDAVDAAFERLPASTEQVIHPEAYPSDAPSPVEIADATPALGPRWGDLDAMVVGELWLRTMLALRLDDATAEEAAAGWDGGAYRAFSDGSDVAVVLRTAWDTPADAAAFADALAAWGATDVVVPAIERDGTEVTAVFATSATARDALARS